MNPWDAAEQMHREAGLDYKETLAYYMHHGYILSTPKCLIFAEPIADAWGVAFAYGVGCIPTFINAMPFWLPRMAWRRALREQHSIHDIDMERLCRLFSVNPEHLKSRKQ